MKKEIKIVLFIFMVILTLLQTISFADNEVIDNEINNEEILENVTKNDISINTIDIYNTVNIVNTTNIVVNTTNIVNTINNEVYNEIVAEIENEEEISTNEVEVKIENKEEIVETEIVEEYNEIKVLDTVETTESNTEDNYANIYYRTHAQNVGWQRVFSNGETAGTVGKGLRLESIEIYFDSNLTGNVKYQSYVENIGWQTGKSNGEESGTNGRGLRLEALRISLDGEIANYYNIYYRVHAQNVGWLGWAKNGEDAGTAGYGYRLEGIEIIILPVDEEAPVSTKAPYRDKVNIIYRSHVQNIGWQKYVANGALSGTSGKGLRVEGMNIKAATTRVQGDVVYSAYVQKKGWLNEVKNGGYAGTSNEGLRMEAIKINLTGELAEKYDIYYRVHAQMFGWLGWAKNGERAGTVGLNYRLEAVEIKLVAKGGAAPGSTNNPYKERVEFVIDNMPNNRTTLNVGQIFTVKYHTALTNLVNSTPRFEALNPNIATIDSNGKITAISKGIANFAMYDASGYMTAGFYVIVN